MCTSTVVRPSNRAQPATAELVAITASGGDLPFPLASEKSATGTERPDHPARPAAKAALPRSGLERLQACAFQS